MGRTVGCGYSFWTLGLLRSPAWHKATPTEICVILGVGFSERTCRVGRGGPWGGLWVAAIASGPWGCCAAQRGTRPLPRNSPGIFCVIPGAIRAKALGAVQGSEYYALRHRPTQTLWERPCAAMGRAAAPGYRPQQPQGSRLSGARVAVSAGPGYRPANLHPCLQLHNHPLERQAQSRTQALTFPPAPADAASKPSPRYRPVVSTHSPSRAAAA